MSENGIKTNDLSRLSSIDEFVGNQDGSSGKIQFGDVSKQLLAVGPVAERIAEIDVSSNAGYLRRNTLTALKLLTPTVDGTGGSVPDEDTGTHLLATATGYDGAVTPNAGEYTFRLDWGRWLWIGPTGLTGKADKGSVDQPVWAGRKSGWADTFFRHVKPGEDFFGRARWFGDAAGQFSLASNSLFDGNALTFTDNSIALAGPIVWFDELGVEIGDTVTLRALIKGDGVTVRFLGAQISDNLTYGAQETGIPDNLITTNSPQLVTLTTVVVSGRQGIRLYPYVSAGSGSAELVALWAYGGDADIVWPSLDPEGFIAAKSAEELNKLSITSTTARKNGWLDPHFRHFRPGKIKFGRTRWNRVTDELSLVPSTMFPDANALRVSGNGANLGGPIVWFDDMGVETGDPFVLHALVTASDDNEENDIPVATFTAAQVNDTGENSSQIAPDDGAITASANAQLVTVSSVAQAGRTGIWLFPYRSSGEGDFDIHALWVTKGTRKIPYPALSLGIVPEAVLAVADPSVSVLPRPAVANIEKMHNFGARRAAGLEIRSGNIGDSWTATPFRMFQPLSDLLDSAVGISAAGYAPFNAVMSVSHLTNRTRTGIWTDVRNHVDDPNGGFGPDASHTTTQDVSATVSVSPYFGAVTKYRLFYEKRPGGGTFGYAVGDGTVTQVNTNASVASLATLDVAGTEALNITIVSAGANGVRLFGASLLNPTPGEMVMHKLGSGGADAKRFKDIPEAYFKTAIEALELDIACISFGTNEDSYNTPPNTFIDDIEAVADRILAQRPQCDILLIGAGPNGETSTPQTIARYNDYLYGLAMDRGWAFIDLEAFFGSYSKANTLGLYADIYHPNVYGGKLIGHSIFKGVFEKLI